MNNITKIILEQSKNLLLQHKFRMLPTTFFVNNSGTITANSQDLMPSDILEENLDESLFIRIECHAEKDTEIPRIIGIVYSVENSENLGILHIFSPEDILTFGIYSDCIKYSKGDNPGYAIILHSKIKKIFNSQ